MGVRPEHGRKLEQWLRRPLGRRVYETELSLLEDLPGVFGFFALQLGYWGPERELLSDLKVLHRFRVCPGGPEAEVRARLDQLPFQSESVDAVILPHSLEFAEHPHRLLREVDRILVAGGHVLVLAFNPWGPWGLRRFLHRDRSEPPWSARLLGERRIRDWLSLLGYEIVQARRYFYRLPVGNRRLLERLEFMERAGPRIWPMMPGAYMLLARKRVCTLTPIRPRRRLRRAVAAPALAGTRRQSY